MIFEDRVYGRVEAHEPLLQELIESRAIQRLKGLSQSGISGMLGSAPDFSRYDHSVGVMLLLRRLGSSLEEQVAGLLHDISHTAFSHVADFLSEDPAGPSYHERMWHSIVERSRIPAVLARHGLDWRALDAESGAFPLLEQPQPALCADRVDYFLRTLQPAGLGDRADIRRLLDHLVTVEKRMVLTDREVARWMADRYLQMDARHWSSLHEVALYWTLARAMREALDRGHLTEEAWYLTDSALWERLHQIDDPQVQHLLSYVAADTVVEENPERYDFVTESRVRAIDPDVLVEGVARPLSTVDADFAARRRRHLEGRTGPRALWISRPAAKSTKSTVRLDKASPVQYSRKGIETEPERGSGSG